jgi:hypothetical protein
MNPMVGMISLAGVLSFGVPAFADDGAQSKQSGTQQKQSSAEQLRPEQTGEIPQTGDQHTAKSDAEMLKGKLLKIDNEFYVIETAPGKESRVHVGKDTKMDAPSMIGDWIQAQVTPEGHAKWIKKSAAAHTVEGDLLKVDGDFYVVKDLEGKEVRLHATKDTKMGTSFKVGDRIQAEVTPEGDISWIKFSKPMRGPEGG